MRDAKDIERSILAGLNDQLPRDALKRIADHIRSGEPILLNGAVTDDYEDGIIY
jgi:hypothetical protein